MIIKFRSKKPGLFRSRYVHFNTADARIKLLGEYGYDVMMIFCKADLDTRLTRAASRQRGVSPAVIKNTQQQSDEGVDDLYDLFQSHDWSMYMYDSTNPNAVEPIIKVCRKFFEQPVQNPTGRLFQWEYLKNNKKERRADSLADIGLWNYKDMQHTFCVKYTQLNYKHI